MLQLMEELALENSAVLCPKGPVLPLGGWVEAGRWQAGLKGAQQLPHMLGAGTWGPRQLPRNRATFRWGRQRDSKHSKHQLLYC